MVQLAGDTREEADARARALIDAQPDDVDHTWYDDERHVHELWLVRESGLGATAHVPGEPDTWEGWEDSAVPVDRLRRLPARPQTAVRGVRLRTPVRVRALRSRLRPHPHPLDLESEEGVARMRAFVERAADLVVSYGGSLSGEHGDGQSRGELLERMFGPELIEGSSG
ncbi:hypothetical protein GCM10023238_35590 [Streptomyces heliomycini]